MVKKKAATEKEVKVTKGSLSGSATVCNCEGVPVREYSSKLHGSDYKKIAEGFAKKIGGSVK